MNAGTEQPPTEQLPEKVAQKPKPAIHSGGALAALVPQSLDDTFRLAQALSMSGDMVPQHFQGKPEAVMAAILRGMEIGLAPMQALSNIAVINGRASLWGDALPALMQRAGHHIDVVIEGDGASAVAIATLTRGDSGREIVRRFSWADAVKAGLSDKKGPWQQYPKRMLSHRARAWAVRDGAADALMGLQIAEETSDYEMRDVTPRREASSSGFAQLAMQARQGAATPTSPDADKATPAQAEGATDEKVEAQSADEAADDGEDEAIDPESAPYKAGSEAARESFERSDCPHKDDAGAAQQWLAGFDAELEAEDQG